MSRTWRRGDEVVLTATGTRGTVLGGPVPRFYADEPTEYVVDLGRTLPAVVGADGLEHRVDDTRRKA